ncbi:hypothetical protein NOCA2360001 [metagenome]|uniref:Uncharacterized protein n=1 Tax=metagenome TaxID=256318 RepID=A0A2P2C784_9ZZZZ
MPMAGNAIYPATKTAVNWLSQVGRMELSGDSIQVTMLLPSLTDTEFYPAGTVPTGLVAHSQECVGRVILCGLRTGEERIDIPHTVPSDPSSPRWAERRPSGPRPPLGVDRVRNVCSAPVGDRGRARRRPAERVAEHPAKSPRFASWCLSTVLENWSVSALEE